MITKVGVQCDVHDVMLQKGDRYYTFMVPPGRNFGGIARKGSPKKAVVLVGCSSCWPKVQVAFKTKQLAFLPAGRFRNVLMRLVLTHGVHNLRLK